MDIGFMPILHIAPNLAREKSGRGKLPRQTKGRCVQGILSKDYMSGSLIFDLDHIFSKTHPETDDETKT